jgi:hypothetical protein
MRLSPDGAEFWPELFMRIPVFHESVFRAAVIRDGLLITDVLQVWLDLSPRWPRAMYWLKKSRHRVLASTFEEP